ncbi:MAG: AMP-binding protein [Chitinophagaceae bacterium]|nr:AMP-binding protein [Chitinophagaceae bacterium]
MPDGKRYSMFEKIYQRNGSATFLQVQNKTYSYQWLQEKIKKTGGFFRDYGIKRGDRLLIALSDEAEFAGIFVAALANGITLVMLDPATKTHRAKSIMERVSPSMIIADQETLASWNVPKDFPSKIFSYQKGSVAQTGLLGKFLQKSKPLIPENDYLSLMQNTAPLGEFPLAPEKGNTAYVIFTSGTTAASKGVAITYENLTAHLSTLQNVYGITEQSILLNQLLLWHADGCIQGPLLAACSGCCCHRPFSFAIDKIPSLLDYGFAHDVSHWFVVPAMLNMIVSFSEGYEDSFNYPAFKAMISVSAHLEAPLWDKVESTFRIRVCNVYGLTETVAGSLFCGPLPDTYKKYTAGKPVDTQVRIVDSTGVDVTGEETGELLLKGPHIMSAYYGDAAATAQGFENGWLLTGDFASRDEEGFITIRGRKKNLIISGGFNIQPEEVTECLLKNEAVSEACAIGLHDEVFGEKLIAAVVLKPGADASGADIVNFCRQWLEEKKVPQKIFIIESLPKGVSGKVLLPELRIQLAQSLTAGPGISGAIGDEVLLVAAEAFQLPAGRLTISDTSQTVSGWDSLAHLTFITLLEEKFNVRFSTAEVMTLNSIKRATQLLKEKHV